MWLDGRFGYVWRGPETPGVLQNSGFLIAKPWLQLVQLKVEVHNACPRRTIIVIDGKHTLMSTYCPYVGKMSVPQHKLFLKECIDLASHHGVSWWMGDFNLRGIAPGHGAPAKPNSSHKALSEWFANQLTLSGRQPLRTPPTHNKLGSLDLHVVCTDMDIETLEISLQLHGMPAPCRSDHKLSMVTTLMQLPGCRTTQTAVESHATQQCTIVQWKRSTLAWKDAMQNAMPVLASLGKLTAELVDEQQRPLANSARRAVMNTTAAVFDLVLAMEGHASKLTTVSTTSPEKPRIPRAEKAFFKKLLWLGRDDQHAWIETAAAAFEGRRAPALSQDWMEALAKGPRELARWFAKKPRGKPPPKADVGSDEQARAMLLHRHNVSALDPRCSKLADEAAERVSQKVLQKVRACVANGSAPVIAWYKKASEDMAPEHQQIFIQSDVRHFARRRPERKASSWLPLASTRALADTPCGLATLTSILDLTWATGTVSEMHLNVQIAHAFKGKGKPATAHSSFRPLGITHPLLGMIGDGLLMRSGRCLTGFAGRTQWGGRADARRLVISRWDNRARRRRLGLPTLRALGDAKNGYDGGRKARFITWMSASGAQEHDVAITADLLLRHQMSIRHDTKSGTVALLEPVKCGGGGTIQGLSPSGAIYSMLTCQAYAHVRAAIPPPAVAAHPAVEHAIMATYTGNLTSLSINEEAVKSLQAEIEQLISCQHQDKDLFVAIRQKFAKCRSDAERLLLFDALGLQHEEPLEAFIDDSSFPASSPATLQLGTEALSSFAETHGVVYDSGDPTKTSILTDYVSLDGQAAAQLAIVGKLQNSTPHCVTATTSLGVPERGSIILNPLHGRQLAAASNQADADAILRIVLGKTKTAAMVAASHASECPWPLLARVFYLAHAESSIAFLSPLCIHSRNAAFALKRAQKQWAVTCLFNPPIPEMAPKLDDDQTQRLLADLGWPALHKRTPTSSSS